MGGLRGQEILIILILLILVFGWKRLPDAARSLGRSARVFKSEVEEMKKDGKGEAADETVQGQSSDSRPAPQVTPPPPVQDYQAPQSQNPPPGQQPQYQPAPQAHPQQAPQQQGQQAYQPPAQDQSTPDDPTRPVA
ncbi:MAG: Sec-independent protein translocase subunit TatA [Dermatophilaceae bacterium]